MVPRTQSDSGPALGPRPTLDRGVEVCPSYSNSPPAQPLCCPGLKSPVEPQSPASVWSRVRLLSGARSRVWSMINLLPLPWKRTFSQRRTEGRRRKKEEKGRSEGRKEGAEFVSGRGRRRSGQAGGRGGSGGVSSEQRGAMSRSHGRLVPHRFGC